MTDLRTRLADALSLRRHEFRYPSELHPSCCTCGDAHEAFGQHLADVLLSLSDIAVVELPEGFPMGKQVRFAWIGPCGNALIINEHDGVFYREAHRTPSELRSHAAALLAAAKTVEELAK